MHAKPRKRRRSGSIGELKAALWAAIAYNRDVIENETLDHETRRASSNCLTQAAMVYRKLLEEPPGTDEPHETPDDDVIVIRSRAGSNGHHA